ncbi:hypothetical protein PV439_11740 [Streptomyces scabiei]|uniref:hypothetical protein n=1 Tax=Streptomyces scabiei TaxID=1930 RepID=UPI00298F4FC6|nr:hypothetical protein [Streptomyces scabiei]MDW8804619.1 hypothetical protein [Streptomyces scabiei]MDX2652301.1 hypothetical protein [Streptomyces scabiei]MDX2869068.1 hypothetical protein [Streptomyces scabiei]MDX2889662.1 hypothetical protein [Streptomyces scabiei]MDX2892014.1 hypothetical protein [Streptomyces scabiei]
MTAPWPPAELPGLAVAFESYDSDTSRWVRKPTAVYRCVCGFRRAAEGARDVALLCVTVPAAHRAVCRHHTTREAS